MLIEPLETAVIDRMLKDPDLSKLIREVSPCLIAVTERNLSNTGFITHFARSNEARLFNEDASLRWGKVIGHLNENTDADFLIYIDDGYLTSIEGCTFGGESWPAEVSTFELADHTA